ncbi:MAG: hypothetical protein JWR56_1474 [Massilia sp.]|nr:hypothetical protein [Massilia sp.]
MYPNRHHDVQQSIGRAWRAKHAARIALIALGMLAAHAAWAQASASVSFTSEFSVRGVSLSDGRAAPQLSFSYDGAQGWYAGAFAAPNLHLGQRSDLTELITYGGYAHQLTSGLSWEAGASSTAFRNASDYNYREVYVGLASDRISGRLYLAPAYYGYGGPVAYGELNGFYPLRDRIKLIAHIGALHRLHGQASGAPDHVDLRLAISYDAGACNVQLAWLGGASIGSGTVRRDDRSPRALALSASYSF